MPAPVGRRRQEHPCRHPHRRRQMRDRRIDRDQQIELRERGGCLGEIEDAATDVMDQSAGAELLDVLLVHATLQAEHQKVDVAGEGEKMRERHRALPVERLVRHGRPVDSHAHFRPLEGAELDPAIGARTGELFQSLGIGEVIVADAREPALYAGLPDGQLAFVGNENVPAPKARLSAEPFSQIHAALFSALSPRLKKTIFFPEALVVRDREAELDVVLSKNNRFQLPRHFRALRPKPRAIVIEGRLTKLWQVGKDFREHIPESWLVQMPGRW